MNKHNMRWISLVLSIAVMIGSLTYIAAGFNAETTEESSGYYASDTNSTSSGKLLDGNDIISTDEDTMIADSNNTWVYEAVLRGDDKLVNENGSTDEVDVFFNLIPKTGSSVAVDDSVAVTVTMDNSTMQNSSIANSTVVDTSTSVKSVSFSVAYDGTCFDFVAGTSNIEGVEFTKTGSGKGSAVQVSYTSGDGKPEIKAYEMPCFNLGFEAIAPSGNALAEVKIEDSVVIAPASLTTGVSEAEEYKVYAKNGNCALNDLSVSLKNSSGTTPVYLSQEFAPGVYDYFITVPYDTLKNDIVLNTVAASSNSRVSTAWENDEFGTGMNKCVITVTAADNSKQEYNLYVKKLALDTLADPQTTITKTVKLAEEGSSTVKDVYDVSYKINGVNDLLAGGKDYVIYIAEDQNYKPDIETIRANTANLEDSTLTVIDMSLSSPQIITYDLSSAALESESERASMSIKPDEYLLSNRFTNDEKYLIIADSSETDVTVTERSGYTEILLPDNADIDENLAANIDNVAAEFVFIVDFSSANGTSPNMVVNNGIVKSLFGYAELNSDGSMKDGIPGYVKQIRDMLSNDSTAKVTIIAVGADIGAGETDTTVQESYGMQFVDVTGNGVSGSYDFDWENSVYRGQTYTMPLANNEFWGLSADAASEQHNIWEYAESYNLRHTGGSNPTPYTQAAVASDELLSQQYAAAVEEAKALLEDADNAQLVFITPQSKTDANRVLSALGTASDITTTVIPLGEFENKSNENDAAKGVYEELVIYEKNGYNCNPGDNKQTLTLTDEINLQVFNFTGDEPSAGNETDNYPSIVDAYGDDNEVTFEWYLPAVGDYSLYADYSLKRWTTSNIDTETHYYPLSNTVNTEVDAEDTVIKDDIPTVAPSYDDEYELTVTKAITDFKDNGAAMPEVSKIEYALLYTNTGINRLTNVGITDSQIMLAGNDYKVYVLDEGKLKPDSNDYPLNVTFTSAGGNKGEATISTLDPGETIYVEYTITIPEATKVTAGTSSVSTNDANHIIKSYIIENIATGAAKEVDLVQVKLDTEFEYDKDSNGTVSTSTSATSTTTTTTTTTTVTTTLPTVTTYKPSTTTTTRIIYKEDISTGESGVGYIVAISLLFGALGVFGVTVYGIMLDKKIERAAAVNASGKRNNIR